MLTVGLDLGSTTTKIAAVENGKLVATDMSFTGYNMEKAWRDIFAGLLDRQGINQSDIDCNSSQAAKAVTQSQRAVYAVLDDFARGGFAHKREAEREIISTLDTERWSRFVEPKGEARFIQWADVFSALQEILVDRIENEKAYGSPYLASSTAGVNYVMVTELELP
jgi:hypothetical protein